MEELLDDAKLAQLGNRVYVRSIEPLKRAFKRKWPVVGFDTEYTSKLHKLICFQLWTADDGIVVEVQPGEKMTPAWIYQEASGLLGYCPSDILLPVFFSLAELQHLPVVSEGFDLREYACGSLDVSFRAGSGRFLHIFDLQRWWSSPNQKLSKAAKSVGMEKKDWNTRKVTRHDFRNKKFRDYSLHDAKLMYDMLGALREKFIEETGVDPVVFKTPAGTAAAAFRNMHVQRKFFCDSNRARWLACKGTWGGHAEVFRRGQLKGEYKEWDFKSAYPTAVLKLGVMPIQKTWKRVRTLKDARNMRGGFCRVWFKWPKTERFPSLPVACKNAMVYPLQGESFCTLAEIRVAVDVGCDVKILEAWGYRKGTTALKDFLQWTLENRKTATGAGQVMYKLLGNSIIGKFAQRISKVPIDEYFKLAEEWNVYLDELFELSTDELEALGAQTMVSVGPVWMPEWNGLITGYTRAALAQMIRTGEAVYCHTDSVWTKKKPKSDMLPFDMKTCGPVKIVRTRFGCIGEPITRKAVLSKTTHVAHHSVWNLTAACQMLSKFTGQTFTRKYPIRRPLKLRESIKTNRNPGEWVEEWRCASTKWDHKRRLHKDGTTSPWKTVEKYLEAVKKSR